MQSYSVEQPKKKGFFKKLFSEPEPQQKSPEQTRRELFQQEKTNPLSNEESYRKGSELKNEDRP
jgi:hypothetical protein